MRSECKKGENRRDKPVGSMPRANRSAPTSDLITHRPHISTAARPPGPRSPPNAFRNSIFILINHVDFRC